MAAAELDSRHAIVSFLVQRPHFVEEVLHRRHERDPAPFFRKDNGPGVDDLGVARRSELVETIAYVDVAFGVVVECQGIGRVAWRVIYRYSEIYDI